MNARRAAALLALTALTACGSTVATSSSQVGGDGLTPMTGGTAEGQPAPTDPGTATALGSSGTGPATRTTGGAITSPNTASPAASGPAGLVVKAKAPLLFGLPYVDAAKAAPILSSIGAGLAPGDIKGMTDLLIADVNARGGILGHPVKLVPYEIQTTAQQSDYEQAACTKFTQDSHVLVALGAAGGPNYLSCIARHGGSVVGPDWANLTSTSLSRLQWVLQPDTIALDRLARIQAEQFVSMGLFQSKVPVKVGVLHFDNADFVSAEKVLESELAKRGVKVAMSESFHYVADVNDIGQTQAQVQNAVLKFRSNGITHVIGVETNAWLIGFFGVYASQQGYYPRYGYTSDEVLTNVSANVPARALEGSVFFGWTPGQDLVDVRLYPTKAQACIAYMRKKGFAMDTGNQRSAALGICETMDYLKAAITAGGEPVSRVSLFRGARALKAGYDPVATFRVDLGTNRYDGVTAVRRGAWSTSCSCFAYTSGPIPIP